MTAPRCAIEKGVVCGSCRGVAARRAHHNRLDTHPRHLYTKNKRMNEVIKFVEH